MADLDLDVVHYIAVTDSRHEFSLDEARALAAEVIRHRAAIAKLIALRDSWLPYAGDEWRGDDFIDDLNEIIEGK